MSYPQSEALYTSAQKVMPGGVNSPVRAFRGVGGTPLFVEKGDGAYIYDADGNRYIDYVLSWGPLILGHAHPNVVAAIQEQATKGTSYGAPTEIETKLAELVISLVPSMEMIRFVNSGTEATMSALRTARAYTKRDKILKFEGCYHGHADMLLVQAGSGVATLGLPDSPGVPQGATQDTLTAPFNDLDAVQALFEQYPDNIAAVIIEPIAANMGFVMPQDGYLQGLRAITEEYGAVLIFDEVMTGFRASMGGAQEFFGVMPDMTCLGKVIGGGLPVGAYGGRREIMEVVAPAGPMYQAGTLSGNPLAMTGGYATITTLRDAGLFEQTAENTAKLIAHIQQIADDKSIPVQVGHCGTMMGFYFLKEDGVAINDYAQAKQHAHVDRYAQFFRSMLAHGVYFAPSQFEAGFMSIRHTDEDLNQTVEGFAASLDQL